ncbi:hypothetical protein [Pseudoruegeria sp. SHC-113]|uniref:hypothetical protein n=1 Tax=Pseudoruegeria sp. SHC-113 TaxID=2855439 RepID=UPI0021BA3CBA|nr:hypothetical protein [Pseudoruegeria sp. SHC-113]MCT8160646.1 hypothetical protein [Pseudoruegeria sp. SHC-113]
MLKVFETMNKPLLFIAISAVLTVSPFAPASANVGQAAIDGCIDQIRAVGGPDGQSGTVLSSEYSEANSLIMFQDAGNTVWRCLVSNDGVVAELTVAQAADDGGGAMAGSSGAGASSTERVQFASGTSGAELTGSLLPQESRRYILGARDGQFLYFRLAANGPGMTYVIYNPDGSVLLDEMGAAQEYRGQLWQSGDHVIEVYNTSNGAQSYNVIFGIE